MVQHYILQCYDVIRTSLRLATYVDNNSFAVSELANVIKSTVQ